MKIKKILVQGRQTVGAPSGNLDRELPQTIRKSENEATESDPNSPERKRRVSNRVRMQKRGARRRPFELQTLRSRREWGVPERGHPKYYHANG